MAFSEFQYPDVLAEFGLSQTTAPDLFSAVPPVPPSPALATMLPKFVILATNAHSEASRATWMVGPILGDFWSHHVGQLCLYAGVEFTGDADARLNGYVDFILGRGPLVPVVTAPVMFVVEAKRDSVPGGLGQCIAGMVGMQRFNSAAKKPIDPVFGCVTTGSLWKFLQLKGNEVTIDLNEYTISQADRILGILTHIVAPDRPAAAA